MTPLLSDARAMHYGGRAARAAYLGARLVWPGLESEVLADNPAAYWPLTERPGTGRAVDLAAGHDATPTGGVNFGVPPITRAGTAATLDGVSGVITAPHNPDLNGAGPLTLELWVRVTNPVRNAMDGLLDKTAFSVGGGQWGMWWDSRTAVPDRVAVLAGTRTAAVSGPDWRARVGAGGHLCVTADAPPGGAGPVPWRWYWNGALVAETSTAGLVWNAANTTPVQLGRAPGFAGITLHHAAIYHHALPADRIRAHYEAGRL